MRLFQENHGFDLIRRDIRFTRATLRASEEHAALARPLEHLLTQWGTLEVERLEAEDNITDANAQVAFVNVRLDDATTRFAAQLLADCGGDRTHATYRRYFPNGVNAVTKLGLESQLPVSRQFHVTAEHVPVSKPCRAILTEIRAIEDQGATAVATRESAVVAQTRVSMKVQAFRDEANRARRAVETSLNEYANRTHLPRDYSRDFFPATRSAKKNGRTPSQPPPAPAPDTEPKK